MPTTADVARDFTAMLRLGQFEAAGEAFWADDVTSIEPRVPPGSARAIATGIAAARKKRRSRFGGGRIADLSIDGPFVTGNQFALFLDMMIAGRAGGEAQPFTEIALYTVRDGRIREERYFYD
jgi:SnoaL-like domain